MKGISILGATGSIGQQALSVIAAHSDRFRAVALTGRRNTELLAEQAKRFRPELIVVMDEEASRTLAGRLGEDCPRIAVGVEGLCEAATLPGADMVLSALMGAVGLLPTLAAIDAGKEVALANKEVLVMAGDLVMKRVADLGVPLLPVDSEHSAIFQCLGHIGESADDISRILLTASGGAFRDRPVEDLAHVTVEDALAHPTWDMGPKITIDSATMMNKGFEIIEASHLFSVPPARIEVVFIRRALSTLWSSTATAP